MAKNTAREPYIGRPLPRFEDLRLVAGRGRFTDDFAFDHQAYAAFVRSPHPHARIRSIDADAAAKLPGVIAVFTAKDYAAAGGRGIVHMANPAGTYDVKVKAFTGPERQTPFEMPHPPLPPDPVRFAPQPVPIVTPQTQTAPPTAPA